MYAVKLSAVPRRATNSRYSGIGLEVPDDAGRQGIRVHSFDALERPHDHVVVLGPARSDGEPAVSRDDRCDAVVGGGLQLAIPEDLGVEMCVDVDEPGCDGTTRCIQLGLPLQVGADLLDHPIGDRDVGDPTPDRHSRHRPFHRESRHQLTRSPSST